MKRVVLKVELMVCQLVSMQDRKMGEMLVVMMVALMVLQMAELMVGK